jgi:glycosyltransferase involved in cell wall biosynthesis
MRILQLAPIWETVPPPAYGGTETVVSVLTEELVRRGHEVTLCASGDSCTSADLFTVFDRSLRSNGLENCALQYGLVHVARSLAMARDFDVVHNHSGPPSEIGMALSCLTETPFLTTLHNPLLDDTRFIWSNYGAWYNTISATQAATLPLLPYARSAGVVYNAIDVDSFPFEATKGDYFLFIGRMAPAKAPHLAIEAARRAGARIILAGKVALPEEHVYFHEVVEPLLDGEQARFIGEAGAQQKRDLFAGARALLMPLRWDEPFGLVMIEAMACGTPAIVFKRGAAAEVVADGETGYLVGDVDGMVAAIDRLDQIDPYACRAYVEDRFGPEAIADGYLKVYNRMLGIEERAYERAHV